MLTLIMGRVVSYAVFVDGKQQQLAVVAYFQSFWNEDVYRMWQGEPSGKPFTPIFEDKLLNRAEVFTHAAN